MQDTLLEEIQVLIETKTEFTKTDAILATYIDDVMDILPNVGVNNFKRWFNISDMERPEDSEDVLVYMGEGTVEVARYDEEEDTFSSLDQVNYTDYVLYWRRMPFVPFNKVKKIK